MMNYDFPRFYGTPDYMETVPDAPIIPVADFMRWLYALPYEDAIAELKSWDEVEIREYNAPEDGYTPDLWLNVATEQGNKVTAVVDFEENGDCWVVVKVTMFD